MTSRLPIWVPGETHYIRPGLLVGCALIVVHALLAGSAAFGQSIGPLLSFSAEHRAQDIVGLSTASDHGPSDDERPVTVWINDIDDVLQRSSSTSQDVRQVQLQRPMPPTTELQPTTPLPSAAELIGRPTAGFASFGSLAPERDLLSGPRQQRATAPSLDIILGVGATLRATTDAGNLLGKSPAALGVQAPQRTPIVTDTRVRGNRVGQVLASGSYWVPARMDLDTMLSKIDSRIIDNMIVVKGPYSARYGPGFDFIDAQLLNAPRFTNGFQSRGSSSVDYKTNGEQWYGRQTLWGGDSDWGFRVGYGHRTGNDYTSGNGSDIPASYKSRDVDVALSVDPSSDSVLDFNYLRLDQTDVEYPGQAFDMDFLVTDAFELRYVLEDQREFDRLAFDAWYNRTRFAGDAQRPGKRRQFPVFDQIDFFGVTDVDSMSTGFRLASTWGKPTCPRLTAGVDLRYVNQELNEISSLTVGGARQENRNSPIPRSHSSNPGLFAEYINPIGPRTVVTAGARVDWVSANIDEDEVQLDEPGFFTLSDILGSDEFDRDFALWSSFLTIEYKLNEPWTVFAGAGHGERAPTLTELYAAQPFMFLLQNGLNTVTGDPELDAERLWQIDTGLRYDDGQFRAGINGYHAWIRDYITFENLQTRPDVGQVNLKFVNTDLATLAGFESFVECDVEPWLTPFATLSYVEGRDHTRDGEFATRPAEREAGTTFPSVQIPGLPRGEFGEVPAASEEPLPSIGPLESRIGFRIHEPGELPRWSVELSARIVDVQDRVATSLLESTTPGFTVWTIRSFWRAKDNCLIVAGVENFGDKNYQEYLDYRSIATIAPGPSVFQPGVNFYFGSELTY